MRMIISGGGLFRLYSPCENFHRLDKIGQCLQKRNGSQAIELLCISFHFHCNPLVKKDIDLSRHLFLYRLMKLAWQYDTYLARDTKRLLDSGYGETTPRQSSSII